MLPEVSENKPEAGSLALQVWNILYISFARIFRCMTVQFVYSWQNDCTFNQIGHSLIGFQQNLKKAVTSIEHNDSDNYLAKARYPCHIAKPINYKKWTLKEQFGTDGRCVKTYSTPRRDTYVSADISARTE